ncbi:MAG: HemK/PrmC family methyltransferase [Porphyromonadaceae bacterium]|nr:HemK/PrmC family methyltransferase [Porphyromonadaceae bacterium]
MTTIREFRLSAIRRLEPLYELGEAQAIVRILLEDCLQISHTSLLMIDKDTLLSAQSLATLEAQLDRLVEREPLQYVLGYTHFYGARIKVASGVLIPRPETEELVELIISREEGQERWRVLDVGTGSACIPCALASAWGRRLVADCMEYSGEALPTARRNLEDCEQTTGAELRLMPRDLFTCHSDMPESPYDLIVSNPPYIHPEEAEQMTSQVLGYEPSTALFAPEHNPIIYYEEIARLASSGWLALGGRLYMELNPLYADQTRDSISEILGTRLERIELLSDLSGKKRFLCAKTKPH